MLDGANKRRLELIVKEIHGGGLTRKERQELTFLQDEFLVDLDEKFPTQGQKLEALADSLED